MSRRAIRYSFPVAGKRVRKVAEPKSPSPTRAARMLALAHHVERLIDAGQIADYAEAAQELGLTRGRMTQVMNLLLLSPEVQEAVLTGSRRSSECQLRASTAVAEWGDQEALPTRSNIRRRNGETTDS